MMLHSYANNEGRRWMSAGTVRALFLIGALSWGSALRADSCATRGAEVKAKVADRGGRSDQDVRTHVADLLQSAEYIAICGSTELLPAPAPAPPATDKQIGASGGSGGSTTLVSHGLAPSLLGFAFEAGGLERDISGSVVTFRANPATLIQALTNRYGPELEPAKDPLLNAVSRINLAATFDTARTASTGAEAGNPFRANYQQLSEFSIRLALWNGRDPFRRKNWDRYHELKTNARDVASKAGPLLTATKDVEFQKNHVSATNELLKAKDDAGRDAALSRYNSAIRATLQRLGKDKPSTGDVPGAINEFRAALDDYKAARRRVEEISSQAVVNLEYALVRPPLVRDEGSGDAAAASTSPALSPATTSLATGGLSENPDLSALRLVGTWKAGLSDLSWNAAATFFNSTRPGMRGRFRDFNTGGAISVPLGSRGSAGPVTATLSGRYMHLHQKPLGVDVLFNSKKINTPGNIRWLQGKLTFPGPANGVKIPLSVTWSNRTELIDERDVRINIGFSFDLDAVMQLRP